MYTIFDRNEKIMLRIYVAFAIFEPYCGLEAGDIQSLKSYQQDWESNSGPLAPQAKSSTTTPTLLLSQN